MEEQVRCFYETFTICSIKLCLLHQANDRHLMIAADVGTLTTKVEKTKNWSYVGGEKEKDNVCFS